MAPQTEFQPSASHLDEDRGNTRPWVVHLEHAIKPETTSLLEICDTYEDILDKYGCLHLPGLVTKVMGARALAGYTPENLWSSWEGARTESVHVSFPLTFEQDLPLKTWRKRNARALRNREMTEVLASPISSYWRTVNRSIAAVLPGVDLGDVGNGPVIPQTFKPTYGMVMERHNAAESKYTQLDAEYPALWCQHHADFGGCKNKLYHHPTLETHKLLGIASPNSYYYGGSAFSSFQHHFEDYWLPSVNFLYTGAEKHWVSASPSDTRAVWDVIKAVGKALGVKPDEKKFLLTPEVLDSLAGIRTYPVHQLPGDAVVSAAGATHGGLNLGDNFAEAVNFADEQWLSMASDMLDFYMERDRGVPNCVLQIAGLD